MLKAKSGTFGSFGSPVAAIVSISAPVLVLVVFAPVLIAAEAGGQNGVHVPPPAWFVADLLIKGLTAAAAS